MERLMWCVNNETGIMYIPCANKVEEEIEKLGRVEREERRKNGETETKAVTLGQRRERSQTWAYTKLIDRLTGKYFY